MHNQIATQYAPAEDLPCADFVLLVPLKKSPEYRTLRPRIAKPKAVDSWQEEGLHFFVFELKSADGAPTRPSDLPVAVFTMHPTEPAPISVVVVTPSPDGVEAEVVDLRQPGSVYTAPYVANDHPAEHQNGHASEQLPDDPQMGAPGAELAGTGRMTVSEPAPVARAPDPMSDPDVRAAPVAGIGDPVDVPVAPVPVGVERAPERGTAEQAGEAQNGPAAGIAMVAASSGEEPSVTDGGDDGLLADNALLIPLRSSDAYRSLDGRLADPEPVDAWQEDGLHFFAFALRVADADGSGRADQPLAVFAMHPHEPALVSAVVVAPGLNGDMAEITNLIVPDSTIIAPPTAEVAAGGR